MYQFKRLLTSIAKGAVYCLFMKYTIKLYLTLFYVKIYKN